MLPYCNSVDADMLRQCVESGQEEKARETLNEICRERQLTSSQFNELLLLAERTKQISMIKLLLEYEPKYSEEFRNKSLSALWIAVLYHHENSAELLVRSGRVDVNELLGASDHAIIHDEKFSVLHVLLQMHPFPWTEQLVPLILDHGADFEARDSSGGTPMHHAVMSGRVKLTELLLERGADVNATENDGLTPLLAAALIREGAELVPLLLKHGADATAKVNTGNNALHLMTYCLGERVDLARALIEKGASLDCIGLRSWQPIHYAASHQRNELLKLYLDYGADANALTKNGKFPLSLAAACEKPAVLETLLKRGASIDLRTNEGYTALHTACQKSREQNIRILLSAGADMLVENNEGRTPLALIANKNVTSPSSGLMLQALALRKARQSSIELKDERIIEEHPALRDYYEDCFAEISKMKSMRLIDSCSSVFELLAKSHCEIAKLMRNREFETNFKLCDLGALFNYNPEYILRAFKRAKCHHHSWLKQQDVINEAVYYILPDVVVRRVLQYMSYDCCEDVK